MSALASLRALLSGRDAGEGACAACAHFRSDPAEVEAALPGLAVLSSAHASVRARDGLCLEHDVVTSGARRCPRFTAREANSAA
ncbi:MAG: hypothetical protein J7500_09540 [Sphingomonas sp.]|uniref:hypothetical protein n=1 Tax=Sphingomonas sp. TaxID=28214 RepID=UPI001B2D0E0B|nr:hypothetical protein [Sphingomonas sp.]MBO9622941.1 hypothetical protein [Sphingomonas sp.]